MHVWQHLLAFHYLISSTLHDRPNNERYKEVNGMNQIEGALDALVSNASKKMDSLSLEDLLMFDLSFQKAIDQYPKNCKLLLSYNEFRITNASRLPRTRPQILLCGPLGCTYPNLHSFPLFEVADVVCITCGPKTYGYSSSINCNPSTLFFDILKKLPPGFVPDFYWDNQVEHGHFVPAGIEMAPFPIVASLCHFFLHKSVEHICEVFDFVLPISKFYGNILRKKYPEKIMDIPFGLNWASFDHMISPHWEKSIDVCVTFVGSKAPQYCNKRNVVMELIKKFQEKYGARFSIVIVSNISNAQYTDIIRKSRITLNVTGIHGPYNYRTIEAMCAGSMIFQYNWEKEFFENDFSELFIEGVHGASFNFENFESKLLYYLENRELTEKIARESYAFLTANYTYKQLFQRLISSVKKMNLKLPRNEFSFNGYHQVDMIYYNQSNHMINCMNYGVIGAHNQISWIQLNNLMVLSCTYTDQHPGYQFLIVMASNISFDLKKGDIWAICCKYHDMALKTVPREHLWLIQWNFLMLSLERGQAVRKEVEDILVMLEDEDPVPFDETQLIFKYYVNSSLYPMYQLGKNAADFFELNMELIKVIDKPKERSLLYKNFALKAIKYFLQIIPK